MLNHPTLETLRSLKLHGMAAALEEQLQNPTHESLSAEERIGQSWFRNFGHGYKVDFGLPAT